MLKASADASTLMGGLGARPDVLRLKRKDIPVTRNRPEANLLRPSRKVAWGHGPLLEHVVPDHPTVMERPGPRGQTTPAPVHRGQRPQRHFSPTGLHRRDQFRTLPDLRQDVDDEKTSRP